MNDYDAISERYKDTARKPDKLYSMLPTVMQLLEPEGIVVDVGCGTGFFTTAISSHATHVYGIDNSEGQISHAVHGENITYAVADMRTWSYQKCDRINAPYVINYLDPDELRPLFRKFHGALRPGGKVVGIIDTPKQLIHDNKQFGALKRMPSFDDGAPIDIDLFENGKLLVTLHAKYYKRSTVEQALKDSGFIVSWATPIVAAEGIERFGKDFWQEYLKNCDVSYFVAVKR
jgi:SAM-dependent methyltransferase